MEEYIINPMWFYWVTVINDIKTFALVVSCVCSGLSAVIVFVSIMAEGDGYSWDDKESVEKWRKARKRALKVAKIFVIAIGVSMLLPSKETMYQMMIAKYATHENVSLSVEAIKSAVDYIVEKIGAL